MKALINLVKENSYENKTILTKSDEIFALFAVQLIKKYPSIVIITSSIFETTRLYNSLSAFYDKVGAIYTDDFVSSEALSSSPELEIAKLETISDIIKGKINILVCNIDAALEFMPLKSVFKKEIFKLKKGMTLEREDLIKKLNFIGYTRESITSKTGEYAERGYIVDMYPVMEENPIRIEFFDNEIESIRYFDPESQRSLEEIEKIEIFPASTYFTYDENRKAKFIVNDYEVTSVINYLDNPFVIYKDYDKILEVYKRERKQTKEYIDPDDYKGSYFLNLEDFKYPSAFYNSINDNIYKGTEKLVIDGNNLPYFNDNVELVNNFIDKALLDRKKVVLCLSENRFRAASKYITFPIFKGKIEGPRLYYRNIELENGFAIGDFIFLASRNLFREIPVKKYKTKFKYAKKIKDLNAISPGDYIVHEEYGIGRYLGIKAINRNGLLKDYLNIEYDGTEKLYIPADKMDVIAKYSGKEGIIPRLSSLNSNTWQKTKARVSEKAREMAEHLIKLYAERKRQKGYAFSKEDELEVDFDSRFEYDPTRDQIKAIKEIKSDMELDRPMDRLLCGDVGYGKTEVAFRAMFKAIKDSKQVMYLCPTTILASQQYNSALKRFEGFPVRIKLLNRFVSYTKQQAIVKEFNEGLIDILIGTHRILSKDIKPFNLGLLIIDEEQRFGVRQKELIKEYKKNVDVLTLSATPIPRTLQMSLMGIRGLSVIETAPALRYPVQTYVIRENETIIRDAIYKELARNGQVFVLYNRVNGIEKKYEELKKLVPSARIVVAHGKLTKDELENRMIDFIDKKYDIMLCTTIIETGIDIENVNTLIVYDADRFGLSQLYQIRGRVGRSDRIAYAYLVYSENKIITEDAERRLKAIKEFTELGSGFKIASRDLAIRGAGDILGSEQAGFIDQVGVDLYMRILNKEIERLENGDANEEAKKEIKSGINLVNVPSHIPENYIQDEDVRIDVHKMIASIKTKEELELVKEELTDRFGKIDEITYVYMLKKYFENNYKTHLIERITETRFYVELMLIKNFDDYINPKDLFINLIKLGDEYSIKNRFNRAIITIDLKKINKHYIYYLVALLDILDILDIDKESKNL